MASYPAITAQMEQDGLALLRERYRFSLVGALPHTSIVMVHDLPVSREVMDESSPMVTLVPVTFRPLFEGVRQWNSILRDHRTVTRFVGWECLNPYREPAKEEHSSV